MTSILRGTLAALIGFASTVWFAATPAAADDIDTCGKAAGDEAIAACTRAIDSGRYSGPRLAALFKGRCSEWSRGRESDKAFADCNEAIRLDPNDAEAFNSRGSIYGAKRQYDRAIEDFGQAIRLNPNYATSFYNRGTTYKQKGEYDRAIQDLNEAIRLDPSSAEAFYTRGNTYNAKGQRDRAIEDFTGDPA